MSRSFYSWGEAGWGVYEVSGGRLQTSSGHPDGYLIPAFVDLHIHGAFEIDTMSATSNEMIVLADRLQEQGYAGFLATTVTAPLEDVIQVFDRLPEHPAILGIHLEGPFISPEFPGAQPPGAIEPIPGAESDWWSVLDDSRLKLITLAPELPGAPDLIRRLSKRMRVGAGHTDATYEEFMVAVDAGLSHATHTFNAMRGFHHREPGTVGGSLLAEEVTTELIYDRLHVSKSAAELLLRVKGADKVIAVSDCTKAKGAAEGETLDMWGHRVNVAGNKVRLCSNGALAGSCSTLYDVFVNLAEDFGPEIATELCSINPRRHLTGTKIPPVYVELDEQFIIRRTLRNLESFS